MAKENDNKPQNLEQAQTIITNLEIELAQVKQQKDQKVQEWQQISAELAQEKAKNKNTLLTHEEIITAAKKLGMKTQAEYQTLQTKIDKLKSGNYSLLWWLLVIPVIALGWKVFQSKFNISNG
jgi:hypothetical protein